MIYFKFSKQKLSNVYTWYLDFIITSNPIENKY